MDDEAVIYDTSSAEAPPKASNAAAGTGTGVDSKGAGAGASAAPPSKRERRSGGGPGPGAGGPVRGAREADPGWSRRPWDRTGPDRPPPQRQRWERGPPSRPPLVRDTLGRPYRGPYGWGAEPDHGWPRDRQWDRQWDRDRDRDRDRDWDWNRERDRERDRDRDRNRWPRGPPRRENDRVDRGQPHERRQPLPTRSPARQTRPPMDTSARTPPEEMPELHSPKVVPIKIPLPIPSPECPQSPDRESPEIRPPAIGSPLIMSKASPAKQADGEGGKSHAGEDAREGPSAPQVLAPLKPLTLDDLLRVKDRYKESNAAAVPLQSLAVTGAGEPDYYGDEDEPSGDPASHIDPEIYDTFKGKTYEEPVSAVDLRDKQRTKFKHEIRDIVAGHLKKLMAKRRIATVEDFKHLCRKATHSILKKESSSTIAVKKGHHAKIAAYIKGLFDVYRVYSQDKTKARLVKDNKRRKKDRPHKGHQQQRAKRKKPDPQPQASPSDDGDGSFSVPSLGEADAPSDISA